MMWGSQVLSLNIALYTELAKNITSYFVCGAQEAPELFLMGGQRPQPFGLGPNVTLRK